MADLEIRTIDPFDTDAFDAWHATYFTAESFQRSGAESPWQLEELRVFHQTDHPSLRTAVLAGVVDGVFVTAGELKLPLLDNTDHAEIGVWTHPGHRGRGHGSAMLARLEQLSSDEGRTVLDAEASYPYDAPADGAGHPNADFLVRRGFRYGLGDVNRRLDLPVSDEQLAELAAKAAPHHAAYTLRSFVAPVPDDPAALSASLMTEAPLGELEREALKVANLAFLEDLRPDAQLVTTYNAEVNDHMIGVNEHLGFCPVERLGEFQKRL